MTTYTKTGNPFSSPAKRTKAVAPAKKKNVKEIISPTRLTPIRAKALKPTSEYDMRRMNHEAFHVEFGEYKITTRFELITDEKKYRRVLHDDGKEHRRFSPDKIGMIYCTHKYFYRVPSIKTSKQYKYEEMGAEYAKLRNIYEPPVFLTPQQAEKAINDMRKGLNPKKRMTTKFM